MGTKDRTKDNKRGYENYDIQFIYDNMYIPIINGENVKTSKVNKTKFLILLRKLGNEVIRRYSKKEGTSYLIINNVPKLKMTRQEVVHLLNFYPLSERNLVSLYFRLVDSGYNINVIEDILDFRDYVVNTLGFDLPRYEGKLLDEKFIPKKQ
jgi:hypothetical protein